MDCYSVQDNAIEFLRGERTATVTFSQGRYVTKIKKLAETHPEECQITAENPDSIVAHIPVDWVKISPKRKVSEEQKNAARERLMEYHRSKDDGE